MPEISVIIPCYNQAQFLHEAINSVDLNPSIELIVVDDGSNLMYDRNIFDHWSYENVRLIRQENRGLSAARNTGISAALAEIIIVLDCDDKMGFGFASAAHAALMENKKISLIGGDVEFFGSRTGRAQFASFGWPRMLYDNCIGSCVAFRKSEWAAVGGYEESMREGWEDWDFYLCLLEREGEYQHLPMTVQYYRQHGANMTRSINQDLAKRERLYSMLVSRHENLFRKHAPSLAIAFAGERFRFQSIFKDPVITMYRKLRKHLGIWPY